MTDLSGKVALVTGGTHSIGGAIGERLAAAGASVMTTGLEDERGQILAGRLGEKVAYTRLDLRDDTGIEAALSECMKRFGRLDIIVNCACSYLDSGLQTSREDWLASLDVNIVGPAILVQKALPHLTKPGGVIVNIGSIGGKYGGRTRGAYAAGKAALMQFTRTTAAALGPMGIRAVTVSPGWTWTPAFEAIADGDRDRADRAGAEVSPLGRIGRMEEVANLVAFACSDEASWVNGCDLAVDGGYSALGPDQGRGPAYWSQWAGSEGK
jgi:NAD(P)-dependent dehydrogenase (short-subunit alcohol dehydrogenase family)